MLHQAHRPYLSFALGLALSGILFAPAVSAQDRHSPHDESQQSCDTCTHLKMLLHALLALHTHEAGHGHGHTLHQHEAAHGHEPGRESDESGESRRGAEGHGEHGPAVRRRAPVDGATLHVEHGEGRGHAQREERGAHGEGRGHAQREERGSHAEGAGHEPGSEDRSHGEGPGHESGGDRGHRSHGEGRGHAQREERGAHGEGRGHAEREERGARRILL